MPNHRFTKDHLPITKEKLRVRVIAQIPPGGRCGLYTGYGMVLAQLLGACFELEISTQRDANGDGFPSIWINGAVVAPSDGVIVMPCDITSILATVGLTMGETLARSLEAEVDKMLNEGG